MAVQPAVLINAFSYNGILHQARAACQGKSYSDERNRSYMLRSGIWEESKNPADSSKGACPACSLPQKVYFNRPLRFLSCTNGKCHSLNRLKTQNWRGLRAFHCERLPAAPASFGSYIFINFRLVKSRKQPHFEKISAGMEDGEGRLRKGISET